MKRQSFIVIACSLCTLYGWSQAKLPVKFNPQVDYNLSPSHNQKINPLLNAGINPKTNWNINPAQNININPAQNININPKMNPTLDPSENKMLNPMFANSLHPQNQTWQGHYLFDKDDKLIGFVSVASQEVMLCFDLEYNWVCYYIRSSYGNYNQFSLKGEWTGSYVSFDSSEGFNIFSKTGEWTGDHIQ